MGVYFLLQSITDHAQSTIYPLPREPNRYLSNYWLPKHKCNLPEYKLFTVSKQCSLMVPMQLTFISDLETPSGQWNQQIHIMLSNSANSHFLLNVLKSLKESLVRYYRTISIDVEDGTKHPEINPQHWCSLLPLVTQ